MLLSSVEESESCPVAQCKAGEVGRLLQPVEIRQMNVLIHHCLQVRQACNFCVPCQSCYLVLQLVLVSLEGILMTMPVSVVDHTIYIVGPHSPALV